MKIQIMVAFIGIWGVRYDSIGDLAWIYFFTAIAALIFLLADGTIRRAIEKQQFGAADYDARLVVAARLGRDLAELEEDYSNNLYPEAAYKRMKKKLLKQIENLRKH